MSFLLFSDGFVPFLHFPAGLLEGWDLTERDFLLILLKTGEKVAGFSLFPAGFMGFSLS